MGAYSPIPILRMLQAGWSLMHRSLRAQVNQLGEKLGQHIAGAIYCADISYDNKDCFLLPTHIHARKLNKVNPSRNFDAIRGRKKHPNVRII